MVSDLMHTTHTGHSLEGLMFGGAPAPETLPKRAKEAFPDALM